jgi:multidrug transporter EmrE-like cation transporter
MIQDLWNTVSKYPKFVIGVVLGVILNALAPLAPLFKRPLSAIALVGFFVGSFAFLSFTLRAMLGLN